MTTTVSIRELSRNTNLLSNYDYVEVEDRKSHEFKGLFVSPQFAKEVKEFIDKKIANEKKSKLMKLMKFAGIASGDTKNMTPAEIKAKKNDKYKQ